MQTRNRKVRGGGRGSPPRKTPTCVPPSSRKKKAGKKKEVRLVTVVLHRKDAKGENETHRLVCLPTDTIGDFHHGMMHIYSDMKDKGSNVVYSQTNAKLGLDICVGDLKVLNDMATINGDNGDEGSLRLLFI